jgi:iron complex transport system permease protein
MRSVRHRAPWILGLVAPVLFIVALAVGRYGVSFPEAFRALFGMSEVSEVLRSLILRVRLPRILAAMCVGANLAVSGAVFQGLFRNPLVDSRILGVSSGAAFGAAIALLFSGSSVSVQTMAFLFALVAVGLVCLIGWRFGSSTLVLIIGGVLVGAMFNALLGLVKYVADPLSTLPAITYWLLGSLSGVRWSDLPPLVALTLGGLAFLLLVRWRLNLLTLSEREASSLGINVRGFRTAFILVGTVLIAVSVSTAGMIGWIGLIIPHLGRAWVGPDHARLLPVAIGLGAVTLLGLDTISRTAMASEIPLGILTGLIGVPAFLLLFLRFLRSREEIR